MQIAEAVITSARKAACAKRLPPENVTPPPLSLRIAPVVKDRRQLLRGIEFAYDRFPGGILHDLGNRRHASGFLAQNNAVGTL